MNKILDSLKYFQQVVDLSSIQDFSKKEADGYIVNFKKDLSWMKLNNQGIIQISNDLSLIDEFINFYKRNYYKNDFIPIKKTLKDELAHLKLKNDNFDLLSLTTLYTYLKKEKIHDHILNEIKEYLVKDIILSPICLKRKESLSSSKKEGLSPFLFFISVDFTKISNLCININPLNIPKFSLSHISINKEDGDLYEDNILISYEYLKKIHLTHSKEMIFQKNGEINIDKWNGWIDFLNEILQTHNLFNNFNYSIISESWIFNPDPIVESMSKSYSSIVERLELSNDSEAYDFSLFLEYIGDNDEIFDENFDNFSYNLNFDELSSCVRKEYSPSFIGQLKENFNEESGFFGLNINQRTFLYCLRDNQKKMLALNGPPGTGKTTVLQSVVATLIVDSIIKSENPIMPIIFGISSTNQAKNNIIDGFKINNLKKEKEKKIDLRWIKQLNEGGLKCELDYGVQIKPPFKSQVKDVFYVDDYESMLNEKNLVENKRFFIEKYNASKLYESEILNVAHSIYDDKYLPNFTFCNNILDIQKEIKKHIILNYELLKTMENSKKEIYKSYVFIEEYDEMSQNIINSINNEKANKEKLIDILIEHDSKISELNKIIGHYEKIKKDKKCEHDQFITEMKKRCKKMYFLWSDYKKNMNFIEKQLVKVKNIRRKKKYTNIILKIFHNCSMKAPENLHWDMADNIFNNFGKENYSNLRISIFEDTESDSFISYYNEILDNNDIEYNKILAKFQLVNKKIKDLENLLKQREEKLKNANLIIEQIKCEFSPLLELHSVNCDNFFDAFSKKEKNLVSDQISFLIDNAIKPFLFDLSMKFYEAKFIIDAIKIIEDGYYLKNGKFKTTRTKEKYDLFSNLSPVFVSTMHSMPNALKSYDYKNKTDKFLFEYIDYLIVDEAGQCSPEIGALSFLFAKKSIIVGDTEQIPPVYSISDFEDYSTYISNVEKIKHEDFSNLSHNCSTGSVMKIAQRESAYEPHIEDKLDRGLYLLEHRRCPNEIIEYCNELIYKGNLIYAKGYDFKTILFDGKNYLPNQKPWHFFDIRGKCEIVNGSRINKLESEEIIKWIDYNYKFLTQKGKKLKDVIAILTPFSSQEKCIRDFIKIYFDSRKNQNVLDIKEFTNITIGTAHKLQGAEKDIILFSMVYDENNIGKDLYIDREKSIINVAVSRAKQSFYVFGNQLLFEKAKGLSTKLMWKHIKKNN